MAQTSRDAAADEQAVARYMGAYRTHKAMTVTQYYDALESGVGYAHLLGRVRHWGY